MVTNTHTVAQGTAMPSAGLPELGPALVHPLSVSMQSWANSAMSLSYPLSELEKERELGKPLSLQTVRVCLWLQRHRREKDGKMWTEPTTSLTYLQRNSDWGRVNNIEKL